VKLLRVLQDRQFEPVGSNDTRTVDVRVLLATNRDLAVSVEVGDFREDLYYRINVINIELPSLRGRPGDIPALAKHFLVKYSVEAGKRVTRFDEDALRLMQQYDWPGNVRELENCVERAVLLCRAETVDIDDLPPTLLEAREAAPALAAVGASTSASLGEALAGPEKRIIEAALARHGGNRQATASQLQINRTTLYKKMKKYGLLT
jgi:DNA-binding NtrC family response regulator